ncbi:MAG: glutaredoxin family protein [Burkholderiales bacterium]|nr:glutaredoxin family protein [Burkholderiales bacterium]
MPLARPSLAALLLGLATAALVAPQAGAQQVFRIVGPDGKVTFSDKPPVEPNARASTAQAVPLPGGAGNSALPFELRQVASRYPVTFYTGNNCGPCGAGRALLASRGIPYTEKTVTTNEDIEALQRMSGGASLPFLTIGGQQLNGYSEIEWVQFLDAAGYPKNSLLPASYRPAPATPLVAVQQAPNPNAAASAAAAAARAAERPRASAPAAEPPADNPAGIKF